MQYTRTKIAVRATTHPPEHLVGHCLGRADFAIYDAEALFKGKRAVKSLDTYDWIAQDDGLPEDRAGRYCSKQRTGGRFFSSMLDRLPQRLHLKCRACVRDSY